MKRAFALAALILVPSVTSAQTAVNPEPTPLAVTSATPRGELERLSDANQVRITFSEPMVAIGTPAAGNAPRWIHVTPAARTHVYWSGTRTLIVSPDPAAPWPFATTFTITVDAGAASLGGHALNTPYTFAFTTPTVRVQPYAQVERINARFDAPARIVLRFNQPVNADQVVAHTHVTIEPHAWTPPVMSAKAREWLRQHDPEGIRRFDEKVDAVRRVASDKRAVPIRLATEWDTRRYPASPLQVVVETVTAPAPDTWLRVAFDAELPSPAGPERHPAQSVLVELEPTLFVDGLVCDGLCRAGTPVSVLIRGGTPSLTRAVTVTDVTDPADERPITPTRPIAEQPWRYWMPGRGAHLDRLGFEPMPPAHQWRVRIAPDLQSADGQTLGYPWIGFAATTHENALLGTGGSVWEAGGGATLPLLARNVPSLRAFVAPVKASDVPLVLEHLRRREGSASTTTRALDITTDVTQVHALDVGSILSARGTGLVQADLTAASEVPTFPFVGGFPFPSLNFQVPPRQRALLQITNLGVTLQNSVRSTLVFVTRLDTGEPVAGAKVTVTNENGRTVSWRGVTGADGVAAGPPTLTRDGRRVSPEPIVATAEKDGDAAFVEWNERLGYEAERKLIGGAFTDRALYKPGETLHVKAVFREHTPRGFEALPPGSRLSVLVLASGGQEVGRHVATIAGMSSADWTWQVPSSAPLGSYRLRITRARHASGANDSDHDRDDDDDDEAVIAPFRVAEFRRPDFRVETTLTATAPVMGSTLVGSVDARYLFGAPLGPRPVNWSVRRDAVMRAPDDVRKRFPEERYAIGYLPREGQGEFVSSSNDALEADGRLKVPIETPAADAAFSYTFEAGVESVAGQSIANRSSLVVHPAALYVAVSRPAVFISADRGTNLRIAACDLAGRTLAGVPVTVRLMRVEWSQAPRPNGDGDWEMTEIPSGEWTVHTAAAEVPLQIPVPRPGEYVLRALARDGEDRPARTEVFFYATGPGAYLWRDDGRTIELTPERQEWQAGESARILIRSPWARATALVTIEAGGIRRHRTVAITSTQDTIEIPISEDDVPNVFVSVLAVKGRTANDPSRDGDDSGRPEYRMGTTELTVDDAPKRLQVAVWRDRDEYRPQQVATVSVTTKTPAGKPAAAEVTLWAVDAGLLSLVGYATPDVLKQIYTARASGVSTADSRDALIPRRAIGARLESKHTNPDVLTAPALSTMMSGVAEQVTVSAEEIPEYERRDFRPLVFWLGSLSTGADGSATTSVTLPDSLTSYRIMAVAQTGASQFGFGQAEFRVAKPLTLLAAFPRFLAAGDLASFGATVGNNGTRPGVATISIQSLDPGVLQFGATRQQIELAAGESRAVTFDARTRASGTARVRVTAALDGERDSFELPLTVGRALRPETTATYGETTSAAAMERLSLPAGVLRDRGGLMVELASTALLGLGESARYLDEYPFGCTEQKASRALALLLASDVHGAFKLAGTRPGAERRAAAKTLREISSTQCEDGGFALWRDLCDTTSEYLTGYVLHVMHVAGTLAVTLDAKAVDRALTYLDEQARESPPRDWSWPIWAASRAYTAKVLAEFGRDPRSVLAQLAGETDRLPTIARSYLADALAASGDRGSRYQDLIRRLTNTLRTDADRAHVEERDDDVLGWLWTSNEHATAVVLEGFSRRKDESALAAPLARWLLSVRRNNRWRTTHDNAMALEAFVSYYRTAEPDRPRMAAAVTLDSAALGTWSFAGRSTAVQRIEVPMARLLRGGADGHAPTLSISRKGTGRLYYTARIETFAPEPLDATDRGFRVERHYEIYRKDAASPATTTFNAGDVIRVTVAVTLRGEGRFLALTDPLPAGLEPLEDWNLTVESDLARNATQERYGKDARWHGDSFDHVEKRDDRILAFASGLESGRHEFSYLVRATTAGTFTAPGATLEAMYAPEVVGRSQAVTVTIK